MALLWPISARKRRPDITTLPLAKEVRFCAQNQPQITSNVPIKTSMHHIQRTLYQPPDFFNRELVSRFLSSFVIMKRIDTDTLMSNSFWGLILELIFWNNSLNCFILSDWVRSIFFKQNFHFRITNLQVDWNSLDNYPFFCIIMIKVSEFQNDFINLFWNLLTFSAKSKSR